MTERVAEIVILAEDNNQSNFARRFLIQKGHNWRTIRAVPVPHGRGSGEQCVRKHYPDEVRYYRDRSSRRKAALVVLTDADMKTVDERERELQTALSRAGEAPRRSAEAIMLLIPKRHIETWIYCLLGERVDESSDYTNRGEVQKKIRPAAERFYEWSRSDCPVPDYCVQSLRRGLREVQRIP